MFELYYSLIIFLANIYLKLACYLINPHFLVLWYSESCIDLLPKHNVEISDDEFRRQHAKVYYSGCPLHLLICVRIHVKYVSAVP